MKYYLLNSIDKNPGNEAKVWKFRLQKAKFLENLLCDIMKLTDSKKTTFLYSTLTFYDLKTLNPVFSLRTSSKIISIIGSQGVVTIQNILFSRIKNTLESLFKDLLGRNFESVDSAIEVIGDLKTIPISSKTFNTLLTPISKILLNSCNLSQVLTEVGHLLVLCLILSFELSNECQKNAKKYYENLMNLRNSMNLDLYNGSAYDKKTLVLASKYFSYSGLTTIKPTSLVRQQPFNLEIR
jgi:hypothetical protein